MLFFKEIQTERLTLRSPRLDDAEAIYKELGCNPAITRYTGWNPYTSIEATQAVLSENIAENESSGLKGFSWVIEADGKLAGTVGAYDYSSEDNSIELGYSIIESRWGKGYASEAAHAVTDWLLTVEGIDTVKAWVDADNAASIKVLQRAGMIETGEEDQRKYYEIRKRPIRNEV